VFGRSIYVCYYEIHLPLQLEW